MKQKTKVILPLFLAIVVAVVLTAGGCTKEEDKKETTEATEAEETTEANWTKSTDRGEIADQAISGKINDESVTIKDVQVEEFEGEYRWSFSSLAPDSTCGLIMDNSAVNFSSKILQEGTFSKKMDEEVEFEDYHSYYHYDQTDGTPMSVNVDWSATIVVEEVDEANKKVSGWAQIDFTDELTVIEGSFEADLCE